ncbi:MAG TPA: hypothetical protein DC054_02190 [Blastocatellia bacterium]|nr:hypothetical protein [Blastocatellia bacterium]
MTSDISPDGLVEGVGQELTPAGGAGSSPLKPQDGQWTFRFNYADPSKIAVFVTINFGPPFSLSADMSSEMNLSQVESLNQWLARVLAAMKKKP